MTLAAFFAGMLVGAVIMAALIWLVYGEFLDAVMDE